MLSLSTSGTWLNAAEEPLVPKIYDVSDLVDSRAHSLGNWLHGQPFDSEGSAVSGLQNFGGFGGGGGGFGGGMGEQQGGGGFFSVPSDILPQMMGGMAGGGGMVGMGGGGGMASGGHAYSSTDFNSLIDVIQGAVDNEKWEAMGGDGRISIFGKLLVITCEESMHSKIEQLLSMLRAQMKPTPTMSVAIRIVPLSADHMKTLDSRESMDPALMADDDAAIRISVRCDNRRVAAIAAGERRSFIYGVTPVVGNEDAPASTGKSIGYSPQVITPMIGVIGKVHPVVSDTQKAGGRTANVGLGLVWASTPEEVTSVTFGQGQTMDRLEISVAELETQVAVAEDKWTLAGLMTTNSTALEHVAVVIRWREAK